MASPRFHATFLEHLSHFVRVIKGRVLRLNPWSISIPARLNHDTNNKYFIGEIQWILIYTLKLYRSTDKYEISLFTDEDAYWFIVRITVQVVGPIVQAQNPTLESPMPPPHPSSSSSASSKCGQKMSPQPRVTWIR